MNINHTRDLVRMGNAYYDRKARSPDVAAEDLDRLALATWAFVRSMKRHLSPEWDDEEAFQKELKEKLPAEQAQNILDAAHRPNRALQDLSTAIENLPMHFMRKNEIQAAATIFEDNLGSSERLLTSPIPVFYSRHTARFLSFWLLLLPFGLWGPLGNTWNHIGLIPTVSMLSIFLFGIEELATQLEEPFTILPMQAFCDKIYNWCKEIVSFKPGEDNGMPIYYYDNYKMDTDNVSMVTSDDGVPVYRFETDQPLQPEIEEIQAPDLYTVAYEAAMAAASAALAQTMGGGDVAAPPRAADPYAAMSAPAAAPVVHTPEPVAYTPPPVVAPEPVAYYTPPSVPAPEPVAYTPPPAAPSDPYTAQYNAAMPAAAEPAPASDSYTAQYDSAMAAASAPVGNPELLMELENAQTVTTETSVTTTTTSSNTGSYGTGTGAGGNYLDNLNRNNLS
jgi:predicted membrane chloride channel (bestrophin family)